ncbi:MAG: bifunctional DNA primase/polymerase [Caulobacteraceae bacterium]
MIAAALRLAAHGLAVFPVAADCRRPLTKHGYKDAAEAAEAVRALWRYHPAANVAVACGAVSRAFVLDIDVKAANGVRTLAELESIYGTLSVTWRTRTPSGGLQPERELRNRVNFAPGLDVRTHGGSVCVAPSHKPNVISLYADNQLIHMIPSVDFEEQRRFREGTQAGEVIDYFAANFFAPRES